MTDFGDYHTTDFTNMITYFLTKPKSGYAAAVKVMVSEALSNDVYALRHLVPTRFIDRELCWRTHHFMVGEMIEVVRKPYTLSVEELMILREVWPGLRPDVSPNNPRIETFRRSLIERLISDMQKQLETDKIDRRTETRT